MLAPLLLLAGCREDARENRDLAEAPLGEAAVLALFPPDGALRLTGEVPVLAVLGAESAGEVPAVYAAQGGVEAALACEARYEGTLAACSGLEVAGGEPVEIAWELGGETYTSASLARGPVEGLGWNLLEGTAITRLGGGQAAADQVSGLLGGGYFFVALDGYQGEPGAYDLVGGPVADANGSIRSVAPGFTFRLAVTVGEDGSVRGAPQDAWVGFSIEGQMVQVLLRDTAFKAHLDGEALTGAVLNGALPMVSLLELTAPLDDALESIALRLVELDVDSDLDGEPDAARFAIAGDPAPLRLANWGE